MKKVFLLGLLCCFVQGIFSQQITKGEYYIDSDPGVGSANSFAVTSGDSINEDISFSVSGLSKGFHKLGVRLQDGNYIWSHSNARLFFVWYPEVLYLAPQITDGEYFFDSDPGLGKGTAISITSPADSINKDLQQSLSALSDGFHKLAIRFRDANNLWSMSDCRIFYKFTPPVPAASQKLSAAEFFIDSDPGLGKGTSVAQLVSGDSIVLSDISHSINGLSPGFHKLSIRVQSNAGLWSMHETRRFYVMAPPQKSLSYPVTKAEYFIDSDPGLGKANSASIKSAGDNVIFDVSTSTKGLRIGFHKIFVRVQDSVGVWSLHDSRMFYVKENEITGPIETVEYFIDKDPGKGKGIQIDESSADSIIAEAGYGTDSISVGDHLLSVRAKNTLGIWSLLYTKSFSVCKPLAIPQFKSESVCKGSPTLFTNTSTGNIDLITYKWDFDGDGTTDDTSTFSPLYTFDTTGTYTTKLTFIDTAGCEITYKQQTVVNNSPNADFSVFVNPKRLDAAFTQVDSKASQPFWQFGDNTQSNETNPVHKYDQAGTYSVCLSLVDSQSLCFAKECQLIVVNTDTLFAKFEYSSDSGNAISFTNKSSIALNKFYWVFGDGTYDTAASPKKTYLVPGVYNVCLSAYDKISKKPYEYCVDITAGAAECTIKSNFAYIVNDTSSIVFFKDMSSGGNISSRMWNFGDGITSAAINPKHLYRKPGFYLVSLTILDSLSGCIDYFADFVQIGSSDCKASFSYTVDIDSFKVNFINDSKGDLANYYWNFGDGTFSREKSPVKTYKRNGVYLVRMSTSTADNDCSDYFYSQIQVGNVPCNAEYSYFVDSLKGKVTFESKPIGQVSDYFWVFGDGKTSFFPHPVHVYPKHGYYTVKLTTYNNKNNCIAVNEKTVLVGSEGSDCESDYYYEVNDTVVRFYDNSSGDIASYSWNFGDGSTVSNDTNPEHTFPKTGYYNVCLSVKSKAGLKNMTCKTIEVSPPEGQECLALFEWAIDTAYHTIVFEDNSYGSPDEWKWYFGDNDSSIIQNPEHDYTADGVYIVGFTIGNSVTGCESTGFQLIDVASKSNNLEVGFVSEFEGTTQKKGGYPVDFVGISIGKPSQYSWNFGDGSTPDTSTTSPTHYYDTVGNFYACVTASDPLTGLSDIYCDSVIIPDSAVSVKNYIKNPFGLSVYPNPAREYTSVHFTLDKESLVSLSLLDLNGRKLQMFFNTRKQDGSHTVHIPTSQLAHGMYMFNLTVEGRQYIVPFIKK